MLTERQKETIQDWENAYEYQKDEVRKNCINALAELPLLTDLPPKEARSIINQAVERFGGIRGDDKRAPHGDFSIDEYRRLQQQRLVRKFIMLLYNGIGENKFGGGFHAGIEQTLLWWHDHGDRQAKEIHRNITSRRVDMSNLERALWEQYRREQPTKPPETETERLRRIFRLSGDDRFTGHELVNYIADVGFEAVLKADDASMIDTDSDTYEAICRDIAREEGFEPPNLPYEPFEQIKQIIDKQRDRATWIAVGLNNQKVPPVRNDEMSDWVKREYIELHRSHLAETGTLPSDENLPDYPDSDYRIPYPPGLNIGGWTDSRAEDTRSRDG